MKERERSGNIFDYLTWRGDLPFSADPFNGVDSLILSELVYTDFNGIVPNDGTPADLEEACAKFFSLHTEEEILSAASATAKAPLLMKSMLSGARFRDTKICLFEEERNAETDMQFAAAVFLAGDGTACVAFRGTDGTVVGWKEDFLFSYLTGTQGQQRAAEYLNRAGDLFPLPLRVLGHSKGGNLAMFAASRCRPDIRKRILEVRNNDGPGFAPAFLLEAGYREILPRIRTVIPDTSVIGLLMENKAAAQVIRSSASGMAQHDGFTWQVARNCFVPAELSNTSRMIRETLSGWLSQTNENARKELVETVFSLLESTGAERFSEIRGDKWKSMETVLNSAKDLPKERQSELWQTLVRLGKSGGATATSYLQNFTADKLTGLLERFTAGKGEKDRETNDE